MRRRLCFGWGQQDLPSLVAGPIVEFAFGDVRVVEWADDFADQGDVRRFSGLDQSRGA